MTYALLDGVTVDVGAVAPEPSAVIFDDMTGALRANAETRSRRRPADMALRAVVGVLDVARDATVDAGFLATLSLTGESRGAVVGLVCGIAARADPDAALAAERNRHAAVVI